MSDAYLAGEGPSREIGERFAVSHDFVRDVVLLMRKHGSIEPAPNGGGHYKLGSSGAGLSCISSCCGSMAART